MFTRHQEAIIYPELDNCVKIDTFLILPTKRLIFGQLLIGGNCVQFKPHYKFQLKYEAIILFNDIQIIRILEQINFNEDRKYKPGTYEVINSFALNIDEKQTDLNQFITLPSPQQQDKQILKRLDSSLFEQYIQKTQLQEHDILNICTFDNSKFFFYSKSDLNALAQQEILVQGSQTSDILQSCEQVSQNVKEPCYILEPPVDEKNLISDIQKQDENGMFQNKRKVKFVQPLNEQNQIEMNNQQIETIKQDQQMFSEQNKNVSRPSNIINFPFFHKHGNRINDYQIQKQWKNSFEGKMAHEQYQKYNLLIKVKDNIQNKKIRKAFTKQLIKDALIAHNEKVLAKFQKLMRCLVTSVKNNKLDDQNQQYEEFDSSTTQNVSGQGSNKFTNQIEFIGRKSMILNDNFIRFIITSFYQQKYIAFSLFTQYSACRDGQHLNNFYQSYDQTIHEYYPDPQDVVRIDSLNYNIDRKNLQLLPENFIIVQLEECYIIIFLEQEIPKIYGQFGNIQTFFIIINKDIYQQIQQCLDILSQKKEVDQNDATFIQLQKLKEQIKQYHINQDKILNLSNSQTQYLDLNTFKICYKNRDYFSIASALQFSYNLLQVFVGNCDIFDFNKNDIFKQTNQSYEKIKDMEVIRFVLNYQRYNSQSYTRRIDFSNQE